MVIIFETIVCACVSAWPACERLFDVAMSEYLRENRALGLRWRGCQSREPANLAVPHPLCNAAGAVKYALLA
jgi:hypothetical protein